MIGFHIQNSPTDWPLAVSKLPSNAMNKLLFGVERCAESRAANQNVARWYRWVGAQPLPAGDMEAHCIAWLDQFIDGTFRREAQHVTYIQEYNETLANSQSPEEKARWIDLHSTMARVWHDKYRQEEALQHIRMILCETAIGNDIPWQIAEAAQRYDAIVGYHPYVVCSVRGDAVSGGDAINRPDYVSPHDWRWYSGRWATMDAEYRARNIYIDWAFGEGGPVLDQNPWNGWLDPLGGWKNPDCLNGDFNKYLNVLKYWLDNTVQTQAYREGRILGLQLFTSGAPGGSGGTWANFDLVQPEMDAVADFAAAYPYPPTGEPPDPDPDPDPPECEGLPREQYKRRVLVVPGNATKEQWLDVCAVAYDERQTVTGSYDDAGIGALDNKTAILYDIPNKQEFIDWYAEHYPGTVVEFRNYPGAAYEIVDIVDELPKHPTKEYNTRNLDAIDDLIIHHTVSPDSRTSEQIAVYHVNTKDWPGIAYHYVIGADGGIEQTNRLETISYHARDANGYSVGIALKGDFTSLYPTDEQIAAAAWLVDWLQAQLNIEAVYGHREAVGNATSCPGDTWPEWRDRIA